VRLVCLRLLRDPHEADDAAQQSFLSAYRSMLSGGAPRDAEAWLFTIARNECRARIRDRMVTPLSDGEVETLAASSDPADEAAARERLAAVLAAVDALPPREREAIVLQAFGGVSNAEVAVRLGTTESAVETLLVRARAQLRARAWPVAATARALVLAPTTWLRTLLMGGGGGDVVAAAKMGTAVAFVGAVVALGPAAPSGHQGSSLSGPSSAQADVAAPTPGGRTGQGAVAAALAPVGAPAGTTLRVVRTRVRAQRVLERSAPLRRTARGAGSDVAGTTSGGAAPPSAGAGDSGRGGDGATAGGSDSSGPGGGTDSGSSGSTSSSGSGSGSDSGSGSGSGSDSGSASGSGSDDGSSGSGDSSGDGTTTTTAESGGGTGSDDGTSGGGTTTTTTTTSGDVSESDTSGSGSSGGGTTTSGSGSSGGGTTTSGSDGGTDSSDDTLTVTIGGDGSH
jgi:RNA polymerase sigma factor (sigma-70 family)